MPQPDGIARVIFDARTAGMARQFEDSKNAESQGAVVRDETLDGLAEKTGLPADALRRSISDIPASGPDAFGRTWHPPALAPPFCAVKVTGALFHTQGGLEVDPDTAKVRMASGGAFQNLYAAGGAACGVSGTGDSGYLSGNGLLAAVTLGFIAGRS